jgi:membrane protein
LAGSLKQQKPEAPKARPTERAKLRLEAIHKREALGKAKLRGSGPPGAALAWIQYQLARLNAVLPMRAFQQYNLQHGSLMAAGVGFNMFFSITGLLTTGFSVAGLFLRNDKVLLDAIISSVAKSVPGLLKANGQDGLVDPAQLLNPTGLGLAAIIAAVVTIVTSLGWIQSLRDGLRGVLGLPPVSGNPVLAKLKDVGTLLLLGVALVLTSVVTVVFGAALDAVTGALGLDRAVANPVGYLVGFVLGLLLNWLTVGVMYRLGAGLELKRRVFLEATLLAGAGATVLQLLSSVLLAKAGANPLLAPFAVIIGLLIWFNFVSQVYLMSAGWAAVREADSDARDDDGARPGRARTIIRA